MKKNFLLFSLLLLFDHDASSQIIYGLKAGILPTSASTTTDENPKVRLSYLAGIYGSYPLGKKVGIQAEILYTDKGYYTEGIYSNVQHHRNYINLPIILQYRFIPKIALQAGIDMGYLISSTARRPDGSKEDTKAYFGNSFDFGVTGGLTYQLDSRFNVVLRYTYGLSNVVGKNAKTVFNVNPYTVELNARNLGDEFYNRTLEISLNYALSKQKPKQTADESSEKKRTFSLGVKSGFNINNTSHQSYTPSDAEKNLPTLGGHIGLFTSFALSDRVYFSPEVQFISKGYRHTEADVVNKLTFYYIEVPLIFSYTTSSLISLEAGPVIGQRIKVLEEKKNAAYWQSRSPYYEVNNGEIGLTGGIRFNVDKKLSIACRYYQSTTNISNLFDSNVVREFNHNIQISTYYRFIGQ